MTRGGWGSLYTKRPPKEEADRQREERQSAARRGGEKAPSVGGALAGKPTQKDVDYWTTRLPLKPPGRT